MPLNPPSRLQQSIIELPVDAPAILVKAGPGSGKTRVLCDRIVHLIGEGVDPRQITAVTFTQLAAAELRDRIERTSGSEVWTGTFHGYAYRILNEHGDDWGFSRPIRVLDEVGQRFGIRTATASVTGYRCDEYTANTLASLISYRKRRGLGFDDADYGEHMSPQEFERTVRIDRAYHEWLIEENVFDYDELIYQVNLNLRTDPYALQLVQQAARWLFVDEFQDVSDDQYALISAVAPVGHDDRHLFAVGDDRQSIYSFRGAASVKLFTRLALDYRARDYGLNENFRSNAAIVEIANLIQPKGDGKELVATGSEPNRPIHLNQFATVEGEAARVAKVVKQRLDEGDKPESIAILYSTHRRADAVEQALSNEHIRFHRHVRNSIHDRPESKPLLALMREVSVPIRRDEVLKTIGLEPAGLVDEFDWIKFERARKGGKDIESNLGLDLRLLTLADCIKASRPPNTAKGVPRYARTLLNAYAPIVDVVEQDEWVRLASFVERLDRHVSDALGALRSVIDAGHRIVLLGDNSHDAILAGSMLETLVPAGDPNQGLFYFCLGADVPEDFRGFRIEPVEGPEGVLTMTMQAWRIGQLLLARERFDDLSFVALDIETNSRFAESADIIELGAVRFDPETGESLDTFSSLVQCNKLPGEIAHLTQISAAELHKAPPIHEVLHKFFAWLRPDDVLVGHNVEEFDLAVLERHSVASGFTALRQPTIDTLALVKRLLPDQSAKLEDLMTSLGLTPRAAHRALPDAETTAELFARLMTERDRKHRIRSLDGALPVIAASLLEFPDWPSGDGAFIADLGGRRLRVGASGEFVKRAERSIGAAWTGMARELTRRRTDASQAEESWNDFREAWMELIERHHNLMPQVKASELAASIALTASHSTGIVPGHVTMMTVHAAKGKEWPTVIIIGAEDDQFPSRKEPSVSEIEEGGRLFYVGVTRARSRLMITWATERGERPRKRSRHLNLIPGNRKDLAVFRSSNT